MKGATQSLRFSTTLAWLCESVLRRLISFRSLETATETFCRLVFRSLLILLTMISQQHMFIYNL